MKTCTLLFIIRECRPKPQWGITWHQGKWTIKKLKTESAVEDVEKKEPSYTIWWECSLVQCQWRTECKFLKTLAIKVGLPYDPVIPPLSIYSRNTKTQIQKEICPSEFIVALCNLQESRSGNNLCIHKQMSESRRPPVCITQCTYNIVEHYSVIKKISSCSLKKCGWSCKGLW